MASTLNPFDDAYTEQEIDFYGLIDVKDGKGVQSEDGKVLLLNRRPKHPLFAEYFSYSQRDGSVAVPTLLKKLPEEQVRGTDPRLGASTDDFAPWMSLTWFEMQSHYLPIRKANGRVLAGGLGLGYFALRAAEKESVDSVVVYDNDMHTHNLFAALHSKRDYFDKIELRHGDFLELEGEEFDFCYNDIYPYHACDEMLDDAVALTEKNDFGEYWWWTLESAWASYVHAMAAGGNEQAALDLLCEAMMVDPELVAFLSLFGESSKAADPIQFIPDPDYINRSIRTFLKIRDAEDDEFEPVTLEILGTAICIVGSRASVLNEAGAMNETSFVDEGRV